MKATVVTPVIEPLQHAVFQSIDPCLDPSMPPEHGMPGRLSVDLAFGGEVVFNFDEVPDADGSWSIEVFMEFDDGTPAPLEVGDYMVAVRCLPADEEMTEPVANYEPLSFTVAEATTPPPETPPAEEPAPAAPVRQQPRFTG
ncbi:MAG TPA: hypothetical protein VGJ86_04005 [Acidimicrobiales bacterium]